MENNVLKPAVPPRPFKALVDADLRLKVVDIGANPLDGDDPPYLAWLKAGEIDLIGFEPHPPSLTELNSKKGPYETYLPQAIGDGKRHTLSICHAPGLSSILTPNPDVMKLYHLFPFWSRIFSTLEVDTVRLDDIPELVGTDFIKIDIQGAELMAFESGPQRLRDVSVIHTEVSFQPMYIGQPLFSEVEIALREQGFMFHRFFPLETRLIRPFIIGNNLYGGMSQAVLADAIFVRDFTRPELFTDRQLLATALILHDCYQSFDAALQPLLEYDRRHQSKLAETYIAALQPCFPGQAVWMWYGPQKKVQPQ